MLRICTTLLIYPPAFLRLLSAAEDDAAARRRAPARHARPGGLTAAAGDTAKGARSLPMAVVADVRVGHGPRKSDAAGARCARAHDG